VNPNEHLIDGRIRYRYPTPVAAPYRLARISRSPVVRLGHVLGAVDHTTRFCTFVLLSDYLTYENTDDVVEEQLGKLHQLDLNSLCKLLTPLVRVCSEADSFVAELVEVLANGAAEKLVELVAQAESIRIDRSALDIDSAKERAAQLMDPLSAVLAELHCLEKLLIVQPQAINSDEKRHWYLRPWRGVQNSRPLVIESDEPLDLGIGATLLIKHQSSDAIRLDPFLVGGGGSSLHMLIHEMDEEHVLYGNYLRGAVTEWSLPLASILGSRDMRQGLVNLGLDDASERRVAAEISGSEHKLHGYEDVLLTVIDDAGRHFRANHIESGELHNVVLVHDHLGRNADYAGRLLSFVSSVAHVDHPAITTPSTQVFDR